MCRGESGSAVAEVVGRRSESSTQAVIGVFGEIGSGAWSGDATSVWTAAANPECRLQ